MRRIKHFFFLLCLLAAGAQSAWALAIKYELEGSCTIKNFTFDLYKYYVREWDSSYQYNPSHNIAVLTGINGTEENVSVPFSVENGNVTYYVKYGNGTISNNNVKTLTFQNDFCFYYFPDQITVSITLQACDLQCPQLTKIVFEKSVSSLKPQRLQCDNLTDIVFKGSVPSLSNSWSDYSTAPAGNITVHVASWTEDECIDKHEHATVWSEFAAVVPYNEAVEETVTVTANVSDGGRFQQSGGQELTYGSQVYEVNTHSNFTFLASADGGCQVAHVYLNGRDIIGEMEQLSNGKLRYTIENIRDDVYISVVGENLYEDAWVSVSPGGKVTYTKNNVPTNITSNAYVRIDNGSTQDLFIIPNEGYELDKYWIGSPYPMQDFTETTGLLALEPQEDGSYKLTIDHGFNILFTFKKTGITDGMVTVSASVSGGGRFQKSGGQELTYGSQEYVVDGHSDFTFTVSAGNSSQVAHVYLNGKDIIEEMEQQANGKLRYTIEDMCDNVYISVVGESTIQTAYITTTPGGKVTYTKNDVPKEIATWDYVEFPVDSSLDLFIVPDEGYELEKYWIEGYLV